MLEIRDASIPLKFLLSISSPTRGIAIFLIKMTVLGKAVQNESSFDHPTAV